MRELGGGIKKLENKICGKYKKRKKNTGKSKKKQQLDGRGNK